LYSSGARGNNYSVVVETTQIVPLQTVEGGTIRVSGTRINLESVLWKYIDGFTPEQIRECYPDLDLADIYAVISYYLSHREEVDRYLANQEAKADEVRQRIQNEAGYREWVADFKKRTDELRQSLFDSE
jgi:uncharacterized protein (DUF433 family)